MSLKCRIYKDENGNIDFVDAANGSRSKLFDTLVNITGGNKNTALNLYALTETEDFKEVVEAKVNAIKNRVKSLVKQAPTVNAKETVRFSRLAPKTAYFSNAISAINNLSDKNPKNTQGWLKQLTDTQKNGGVRNVNQELEWIGLEDYLNSYVKESNPKAGNIPASVVEDYINANQIDIVDVSKGKPEVDINDLDAEFDGNGFTIRYSGEGNLIMPYITLDQIGLTEEDTYEEDFDYYSAQEDAKKAAIEEVLDREDGEVKYAGYQLKGGENYREVLLTIPAKTIENNKTFTVKNRKDFYNDPSNFSAEEVEEGFVVSSNRGGRKLIEKDYYYIKTKEDAINSYREDNLQLLDIFSEEQGVEDYDFYDENGQYFNTSTAPNMGQAIAEYKALTATKEDEYKSSHWDEKNILAHIRLNEKTLPDGRKVLIINEVQSDWAQQGRKTGFIDKNLQDRSRKASEKYKVLQEELSKIKADKKLDKDAYQQAIYDGGKGYTTNIDDYGNVTVTKSVNAFGKQIGDSTGVEAVKEDNGDYRIYVDGQVSQQNNYYGSKEVADRTIEERTNKVDFRKSLENPIEVEDLPSLEQKAFGVIQDYYSKVTPLERQIAAVKRDIIDQTGIQPMPYKNTDQWVGLATRRVLQMAAQEGYDGVAFATGNQSADMYSLAKQVDNISWDTTDNTLTAFDKNGNQQFQQSNVTDEKLEDFVGKEVAQKLVEGKENLTQDDEGVVSLKNADLEIGGEGMKTFYNSIVPKVAQKEAQRFDKNAKLGTVDFIGKLISTNYRFRDVRDIRFNGKSFQSYIRYQGGLNYMTIRNLQMAIEEEMSELLLRNNFKTLEEAKKAANENDEDGIAVVRIFEQGIKDHDSLNGKDISDLDIEYFETSKLEKDKLSLAEQPYIQITDKMRSELKESIPMFSRNLGEKSKNEILPEIISRLELSGLANNVYKMSNAQIEAKLVELGLDPGISKQVTMSSEDVDYMYFNEEDDFWEVYLKDGSYMEVYLPSDSTDEEVREEVVSLIREYKIESLPAVYRGINGEFDSNYKGTQYFAVQKRYASVFGRNIEEFKIKSPEILDLDDWNKRWGVENADFGQGLLTVHQENLGDLKEWKKRIKNSLLAVGADVPLYEVDAFIDSVENAKIIKGEDIGNKGQIVFAIKDKTLVEPINRDIKFSKQLLDKSIKLSTAGFTYRGDVYLNTDIMGLDTPIHEFGHLHLDWLKENRIDLYQAGLSLVGKNKEEAQQYIDIVKSTQPDLEEGTEEFNNEVLAQVIGDQGAKLLLNNKKGSIAEWLKSVWNAIKEAVGLSNYTAEQVSAMTLAEFGTSSATELLSGNRVRKTLYEKNPYLRYNYDVNQVARDRFDIPNLKRLSSGSDRIVFDLGDNKVLKVANTARGLAQNMQEGDQELIGKNLLPQVYETGLNYVVAEKLEALQAKSKVPVYNISTGEYYDNEDADVMLSELNQYSQKDFDTKDPDLVEVLKSYGLEEFLNYDIIYGDITDLANWGIKNGKPVHLDAGTFGGMMIIRAYARRKDLSWKDFEEVYNKSQEAKKKFKDNDGYVNFSVVAGNKMFNTPLKDAYTIAEEYMSEKGISTEPIEPITKLNEANSRRISAEFSKMEPTPNSPRTKESYKAMIEETVDQYKKILSGGYKIELNNIEPYKNSEEMINDLRDRKRMRVLSTEEDFGQNKITTAQRKDNPLLAKTKFKDANGESLLVNDIFRFVHDFFGHAKLGNGFGPVGEENAWRVHSRMYSSKAMPAMTTETRGQNSWVNFSGTNDDVFELRDRARSLREQGKIEEANKITDQVYSNMKFAEQKIGLMPSWTSELNIFDTGERKIVDINGSKVYFKDEVNPVTKKPTGKIEIELVETPEELRGQGKAKEALNVALKYTDSIGKKTVLTISPRDKKTTSKGLEKLYTSLGYQKTSDFEMERPVKKVLPKEYDENGEPSVKNIMEYANSSNEVLSFEDRITSRNAAIALGVKSSEDLITKLEKAFVKNGVFVFDKVSLQRGGIFNKYEATKILDSISLQKSIKKAYLELKNTEPFVLEYDDNFVTVSGSELNIFGKQPVANPFTVESDLAKSIAGLTQDSVADNLIPELGTKYAKDTKFKDAVDSIASNNRLVNIKVVKDDQLVDKVEDVRDTLENVLIDTDNPALSENIRFINENISEEVWEENLNLVIKVLASIKKNAIKNGIDLRDITTKSLSNSREDILYFLDTMENLFQDGMDEQTVSEFSEAYKTIFELDTIETELIQTDSEFDNIVESNISEYQLFDKFGLVKKQGDIYRQTEEQSLEDLYGAMFENSELFPETIKTVDELKQFVEKEVSNLEISDYEIDPDNLAKIYLYKKYFGFSLVAPTPKVSVDTVSIVTAEPEYLITEFVKEFNKWILDTKNNYFKVTNKGIELVEKDPLSKEEALLTIPEEYKKDLSEYDAISKNLNLGIESEELVFSDYDSQTEQREFFANNPQNAKKLSGDYLYIEEGVLAVKNETDTFIRTPQGVFEMIYEAGNIKFYNRLPMVDPNFKFVGLEKPLSDVDFNKYQYLENTPEVFKTAKTYYSKKELDQIDEDYFNCQ